MTTRDFAVAFAKSAEELGIKIPEDRLIASADFVDLFNKIDGMPQGAARDVDQSIMLGLTMRHLSTEAIQAIISEMTEADSGTTE